MVSLVWCRSLNLVEYLLNLSHPKGFCQWVESGKVAELLFCYFIDPGLLLPKLINISIDQGNDQGNNSINCRMNAACLYAWRRWYLDLPFADKGLRASFFFFSLLFATPIFSSSSSSLLNFTITTILYKYCTNRGDHNYGMFISWPLAYQPTNDLLC